jgi:hypothetical protein
MADEAPPGEVEKVVKIKALCEWGKVIAENLNDTTQDREFLDDERGRYEKRKQAALELARQITDTFYRDAALHQIIHLCIAANEEIDAKRLFQVVET